MAGEIIDCMLKLPGSLQWIEADYPYVIESMKCARYWVLGCFSQQALEFRRRRHVERAMPLPLLARRMMRLSRLWMSTARREAFRTFGGYGLLEPSTGH